jgi:tRNA nucleotidyltransferase/poly(A) polymerase
MALDPAARDSISDRPEEPLFPEPVIEVARALSSGGHRSWLTGEGLHRALVGAGRGPYELVTTAAAAKISERLPRAVPIAPEGRAFAVPTAAGPVDLAPCDGFEDAPIPFLARRAFTIHAAAWDVLEERLLDPFEGRRDWRDRRLRCPGRALDRLYEAPARIWRTLRCASEGNLAVDEELAAALPIAAGELRPVAALASRRELVAWLSLEDPGPGVVLARRSGLEAVVAPGARPDTEACWSAVPCLPPLRLSLRLAIWLHGTPAAEFLRLLRMGEPVSSTVLRLIAHHPIDRAARPSSDASVGRLTRRLGPRELEALLAWRRFELSDGAVDVEAVRRLKALEAAIGRIAEVRERQRRRQALALDGAAVMEHLGCGPGPRVGRALRALSEWAAEDPDRNSVETLVERLHAWAREEP